tara:strand:+ start:650 stop:1786 length:1137 start_codon:yes stop_codon:yes gene_type:complete
MKKTAGIYIHIPFCSVKCMYCDFYSITDRNQDIPIFINSLIKEIELSKIKYDFDWEFDTIFIGGGTPSLLEPKYVEIIIDKINHTFNLSSIKEITLETNPGEAPLERLKAYKSIGINRLSIGFQSFDPKILKFLDRLHSPNESIDTFKNARLAGFENINADLIFNIPGQSPKRWENDLKQLISLDLEHISTYSLTVEKGTVLNSEVKKGNIVMPNEEIDLAMYEFGLDQLVSKNYYQYEISNFSKTNKECLHNLHYWQLDPYLSFGPSAHSYDQKKRWWNIKTLDRYLKKISLNQLPISGQEDLNSNDHYNELLFNGLRLNKGVELKKLQMAFPDKNFSSYLDQKLNKYNQLFVESGNLKLNNAGRLFADNISSDMFI